MKNILLLFCLFSLQLSFATKIYVVPNGIDNWNTPGSGSQAIPYNLQYGIWAAAPGDSVLLQGIFSTTATTGQVLYLEKNDITIGSWGEGATIHGNDLQGQNGIILMVIKNSSNVTIQDLSFINNYGNQARGLYIWGKGNNITVKNCYFKNIGWTKSNTAIAPAGQGGQALLVLGNKNDGSYTNVKIFGNTITKCYTGWSEALTIAGNVDGFEVYENTISDITNIGIDAAGHFGWVADWDTNIPLNPALNQARNGKITENKVTNCNSPIATSAGIYCDGCRDVEISKNLLNNNGAGISVGCEVGGNKTASNVKVINNIIKNSKESGLFFGSSISENLSGGLSWAENCIIRNNTFYMNGAANTSNDYEIFVQNARNSEISHNIFYIRDEANGIVRADQKFPENILMDYNLFYRENNNQSNLIIKNGLNSFNHGSNVYFSNPQFVNTTGFRLGYGSYAINAGSTSLSLTSSEVDYHYDDRLQSIAVDLGASESVYTTPRVTPNLVLTNGGARVSSESLPMEETTSENINERMKVGIYPNPAIEEITISFDQAVGEEIIIQIIDMNGNILQKQNFSSSGGNKREFDFKLNNRLPNTQLYLRTITSKGVSTNILKVLK